MNKKKSRKAKPSTFKVGELVVLKSGSAAMTVESTRISEGQTLLTLRWMSYHGYVTSTELPLTVLERAPKEAPAIKKK